MRRGLFTQLCLTVVQLLNLLVAICLSILSHLRINFVRWSFLRDKFLWLSFLLYYYITRHFCTMFYSCWSSTALFMRHPRWFIVSPSNGFQWKTKFMNMAHIWSEIFDQLIRICIMAKALNIVGLAADCYE